MVIELTILIELLESGEILEFQKRPERFKTHLFSKHIFCNAWIDQLVRSLLDGVGPNEVDSLKIASNAFSSSEVSLNKVSL